MITKAIEYERLINLDDICRFINRCFTGEIIAIGNFYIRSGRWLTNVANGYEGIGLFKNWDDEIPFAVIRQNTQDVVILDEEIIAYAYNKIKKGIVALYLTFELAFSEDFNLKRTIDESSFTPVHKPLVENGSVGIYDNH